MVNLEGRLDRSAFSVGTFDDDDAPAYWRSRTPEERLEYRRDREQQGEYVDDEHGP